MNDESFNDIGEYKMTVIILETDFITHKEKEYFVIKNDKDITYIGGGKVKKIDAYALNAQVYYAKFSVFDVNINVIEDKDLPDNIKKMI